MINEETPSVELSPLEQIQKTLEEMKAVATQVSTDRKAIEKSATMMMMGGKSFGAPNPPAPVDPEAEFRKKTNDKYKGTVLEDKF